MPVVSMSYLLEAGVHFGHQTKRWNPKMKEYIFTTRDDIYIIDLQKTLKLLEVAYAALKEISEKGGKTIFVGTKKQAAETCIEEAVRSDSFYVTERWLGGTLTNFKTIRQRINYLDEIEKMEEDGTFDKLPKKEVVKIRKEYEKLNKYFCGLRDMKKLPQAMIVIDPKKEYNAIREARKLKIPIFGLVDTNCDPDLVDYVIPSNDDAIRAVKIILGVLSNAICEATGKPLEDYLNEEDKLKELERIKSIKKVEPLEEKVQQPVLKTEEIKIEKKEEKKIEKKEEIKLEKETIKKEKVEIKEKEEVKIEKPEVKKTVKKEKIDLNSLTLVELKAIAKEKKVVGYSKLKKADLIDLLK